MTAEKIPTAEQHVSNQLAKEQYDVFNLILNSPECMLKRLCKRHIKRLKLAISLIHLL